MPIRTGKLWKPCKKCGEMYEAHTKFAGICDKCNPKSNSFINRLALLSKNINKKKKKPKKKPKMNKHDCKYNANGKYCDHKSNRDYNKTKTSKLFSKKRCLPRFCPLDIKELRNIDFESRIEENVKKNKNM